MFCRKRREDAQIGARHAAHFRRRLPGDGLELRQLRLLINRLRIAKMGKQARKCAADFREFSVHEIPRAMRTPYADGKSLLHEVVGD